VHAKPPPGTNCRKIGCDRQATYYLYMTHVSESGRELLLEVPLCLDHAQDAGQAIQNNEAPKFFME
jgi:hypothetical protein